MSDYRIEACRSCSAEVIWATTERGVATIVNAEPTPDGTIALSPVGQFVLARDLKVADRFGRTDLRTSHFATCAQAASWRRQRRRATP